MVRVNAQALGLGVGTKVLVSEELLAESGEHFRPWFTAARVTAAQAHQRMVAGITCWECQAANKKLAPVKGLKYALGCTSCLRTRRKVKNLAGRARRQAKIYGITLEEESALIDFQGGGCVCKEWTGYNGASRSLSTDHDHRTGEVRGKLCKHCNDLLGRVKDDPEYFRAMIAYLANPPAIKLLGSRVVPGHQNEED